jgi:hypothetical protein
VSIEEAVGKKRLVPWEENIEDGASKLTSKELLPNVKPRAEALWREQRAKVTVLRKCFSRAGSCDSI